MRQSRACSHPFRTLRTLWIRSGLRGPEAQRQDRQGQMRTKGRRNQFPHMEPAFEESLAHWRRPYNSILASFLALRMLGSILVPLCLSSRDFCSHDRHERPSHIECWINTLQETVRNFPGQTTTCMWIGLGSQTLDRERGQFPLFQSPGVLWNGIRCCSERGEGKKEASARVPGSLGMRPLSTG